MHRYYIRAPQPSQRVTAHKGKPITKLPLDTIPADYRKDKFAKFRPYLEEILLYAVGFLELIKRRMKLCMIRK